MTQQHWSLMITVTEEDWQRYLVKYKNLMWKISHMISGDAAICTIEDNYNDLCLAALESIQGFHKKTGKPFNEMLGTTFFDKYTKTCLWTAKARKGNHIKKGYKIRNHTLSLDYGEDSSGSSVGMFVGHIEDSRGITTAGVESLDFFNSFDDYSKNLINIIADNPDLLTEQGKLKLNRLSEKVDLPIEKLKICIHNIGKKLKYELEN